MGRPVGRQRSSAIFSVAPKRSVAVHANPAVAHANRPALSYTAVVARFIPQQAFRRAHPRFAWQILLRPRSIDSPILPLLEPTRYDKTLEKFPNYSELWETAATAATAASTE